jgi:hypothetical protein
MLPPRPRLRSARPAGAGGADGLSGQHPRPFAWFTQGEKRQGLYYAHSDNAGQTVSPPLGYGRSDALAEHADVLALGDRVVLAWKELDGRTTRVLAMQSRDRGERWSEASVIGESDTGSDHPDLISDGQRIFVSWSALDLARSVREHPGVEVVFVATDDAARAAEAERFLAGHGLGDRESWIFDDPNPQRLRYEIDPRWYGELPRSYCYDHTHRRVALSGKLEQEHLQRWAATIEAGPGVEPAAHHHTIPDAHRAGPRAISSILGTGRRGEAW